MEAVDLRSKTGCLQTLHQLVIAQNHYVLSQNGLVVLENWDRQLSKGAKVFALKSIFRAVIAIWEVWILS